MSEPLRLDPAWKQAVVDASKEFDYGDLIPMEWLYKAFEVDFDTAHDNATFKQLSFKFLTYMDRFRDELLFEKKMAIKNMRGEGYLILHPHEQAEHAMKIAVGLIAKGLRKGADMIENTDFNKLTTEQIKNSTDAANKLGSLKALAREKLLTEDKKTSEK